ncbi:acyl--CoA ligase [Xanthomonas campestris pv. phormiicola]|nr:acyl--CoA ligase [Xanthomonas campestris pv. phormiicola]UYC17071.1 acyl--CoA ligase [Xanthomonas campestris pv. phormiicola]
MSAGIAEAQVQALFRRVLPVEAGAPRAAFDAFAPLCHCLQRCGAGPGRAVLVVLPNGTDFVAAVFALLLLDAVPVLLPSAAPPARIRRVADLLGADLLIAPDPAPATTLAAAGTPLSPGLQALRLQGVALRGYQPGEVVLLTSGTSGIFSGCVFALADLLRNAARHAAAIGQGAGDRVLINLPMFYSFAFVAQLLCGYALGNEMVIAAPPFTPVHYRRLLQVQAITQSSLTPLMVQALAEADLDTLPPPLRRLTVGGDALPAARVTALLHRNPGLELYLTYGLTQAGPRVATLAAHREPPARHASVGRPLEGVEVWLRGQPGTDEGELMVATDTAMRRRIRAGEEDSAPPAHGQGRVIATGDRFHRDADGYLFFRQRNPSFLVRHGEKVCLRSVCDAVEALPGVLRAQAWVQQSPERADTASFTLDVQCSDPDLGERALRQHLAKVLLRSEQPDRLELSFAQDGGWQKTRR